MSEKKHQIVKEPEQGQPIQRMHPMVQMAMQGGEMDPGMLRELLDLQRDWEAGEAKRAYTHAITSLKRDLPTVLEHDKLVDWTSKRTGERTRYTHTTLASAVDQITPHLTSYGFSVSWHPATVNGKVQVTCRLTHAEGHYEETTLEAPPDKSGTKSDAQGIASTITLLQRYSLLSLLGIATADMREPEPVVGDDERVDPQRNMTAVQRLKQKYGKSQKDAENYLDKPVSEWTGADVQRLKEWVKPTHNPEAGEVAPEDEPK